MLSSRKAVANSLKLGLFALFRVFSPIGEESRHFDVLTRFADFPLTRRLAFWYTFVRKDVRPDLFGAFSFVGHDIEDSGQQPELRAFLRNAGILPALTPPRSPRLSPTAP
jgi:hypothetical protein